jgi:endogenous inhibitor of DNA gyrase (YacG/DUF329 family)
MDAKTIVAALDHFCHTECPHCGRNIAWYEYYTHEEVEKWLAAQEPGAIFAWKAIKRTCLKCGASWHDGAYYCPNPFCSISAKFETTYVPVRVG